LFLSWRLVKFGELEITVHPFFLLFVFLWVLAGLPLQTFLLFILVLGHELTHAIAAKIYGVKVYRVELFPFGGVGYLTNPLEFDPKKEFIVAGAGPAFNLVLFLCLWNYRLGLYGPPLYADNPLILFLCKANIFLFFFNLLPALPLDGGRLLRASLSPRLGLYKATEVAASWGKWQGVFLALIGLLFSYYDYMHLSLSLMGLFLYYAAGREQKSAIYVFLRYLLRKEKTLKKHGVIKGEQLVAMENTTILEVLKRFKPTRYHQIIVLDQACRVLKFLSESQILEAALKQGMDLTLKRLVRRQK
jgi:stage IV sporulation protein FB